MKQDPKVAERRAQILRELGFEGATPPARPTQPKPVEPESTFEVETVDGVYAFPVAADDEEIPF